jgi:hypothetical protein
VTGIQVNEALAITFDMTLSVCIHTRAEEFMEKFVRFSTVRAKEQKHSDEIIKA